MARSESRGPGIRLTRPDWKQADLARRAIGAVLHFGLVQVGDAQHFLHPQRRRGHAGTSRVVGAMILIERASHPAVIGMELGQREVGLHDVEGRPRGADGLLLRRQEIFERPLGRRQTIGDAPGKSQRDPGSSRLVWETPAGAPPLRRARSHRSRISHSARSPAWREWPRSCWCCRIGVVDHLQNGKSRGDLNHRTQLSGGNAHEGVFQHRGQALKRHLAQEAARIRGRIDRFGLGQGDEIVAAVQPATRRCASSAESTTMTRSVTSSEGVTCDGSGRDWWV